MCNFCLIFNLKKSFPRIPIMKPIALSSGRRERGEGGHWGSFALQIRFLVQSSWIIDVTHCSWMISSLKWEAEERSGREKEVSKFPWLCNVLFVPGLLWPVDVVVFFTCFFFHLRFSTTDHRDGWRGGPASQPGLAYQPPQASHVPNCFTHSVSSLDHLAWRPQTCE